MSDTDQDKKRNKLGYQRISLACAHCRRRKIRCIVEHDPQGRCQNCIRLKKDCAFYPIDQQSAYEAGSDHSGRRGISSASSSALSSTSPDAKSTHQHGVARTHFAPLPSNVKPGFSSLSVEPSATYQTHYLPAKHQPRAHSASNSPRPPPVSQSYASHPESRNVTPGHSQQQAQFWVYDQSPGSGDFAPFPNDSAQQVRTPSTTFDSFPRSSPEQAWQLQQPSQLGRSMTYPFPAVTIASTLPQYAPAFMPLQQLPPASYAPPDNLYRHMQGPPYSTPIPQHQAFSTYGGHSDYRDPQEHQHGAMPVQQGYPISWDPTSGALGFSLEEQHSIPSNALPSYVVPSQR